jgi:hypothetical protein
MNRTRAAAAAAALLLLLALLFRQGAPGASARPPDAVEREPRPRFVPSAPAPIAPPARDVFRYVGADDDGATSPLQPEDVPPPSAPPSLADAAPAAPALPEGPRLVGIVRQAGVVKAAVAVSGEIAVLREGESVGGYTVLAIDEDEGVRLRDAAGTTLTLSALPR